MTVLEWLGLGAITALCLLAMFRASRSARHAEKSEKTMLGYLREFRRDLEKRR